MATLSKQEKEWVKRLNKLLADCPSDRLAFATTGDCDVSIFNKLQYCAICDEQEKNGGEFISAAARIGALFDDVLNFPNQVESTAG